MNEKKDRSVDLQEKINELEEELAYLKAGVEKVVSKKTAGSSDDG